MLRPVYPISGRGDARCCAEPDEHLRPNHRLRQHLHLQRSRYAVAALGFAFQCSPSKTDAKCQRERANGTGFARSRAPVKRRGANPVSSLRKPFFRPPLKSALATATRAGTGLRSEELRDKKDPQNPRWRPGLQLLCRI